MFVFIIVEEQMRRMKDISKPGGGMNFYGVMPDDYKMAVNANHKLISGILNADKAKQVEMAKHVFDIALLVHRLLKGPILPLL